MAAYGGQPTGHNEILGSFKPETPCIQWFFRRISIRPITKLHRLVQYTIDFYTLSINTKPISLVISKMMMEIHPDFQERRKAILKIAEQVFLEMGYDHASMAIIAHRVDCPESNLYGYFPTKGSLFMNVVLHSWFN
jgi:hypothetical protein